MDFEAPLQRDKASLCYDDISFPFAECKCHETVKYINKIYKYSFLLLMRSGVKGSTSSKRKDLEEDEEGDRQIFIAAITPSSRRGIPAIIMPFAWEN